MTDKLDRKADDQKIARKPRGFAAMGPEFQREIAAQGGRAAHRLGKAHRFDSQEGREAAAKRHAARNAPRAAAEEGDAAPATTAQPVKDS
jgi:general stress protein YciG